MNTKTRAKPSNASPATSVPPHDHLLARAAEQLEEVKGLLKKAATGPALDAETVHDLRVSTRRVSEAAALMESLLKDPASAAVQKALRALRHAAGDLRDLDVMREHLQAWHMPAPIKAAAKKQMARSQKERPRLVRKLRATVASASVSGAVVLLTGIIEDHPRNAERDLVRTLEARIAKRRKQLARQYARAVRKQTPTALHEARIAAKKLRYALEFQKELHDHRAKEEIKALKETQSLLGDHHDTHVIFELLSPTLSKVSKSIVDRWSADIEREQARRAAQFFTQSYEWLNHHP